MDNKITIEFQREDGKRLAIDRIITPLDLEALTAKPTDGVPFPSNHEGVNLVALCLAMARIKELEAQINTMWKAIGDLKPPEYSSMPHGELWEPGTSDPGSRAGLTKGFNDAIDLIKGVIPK